MVVATPFELLDEVIIVHKNAEGTKRAMQDILKKALDKVNDEYKLRKRIGCDIQFGKSYAEIH